VCFITATTPTKKTNFIHTSPLQHNSPVGPPSFLVEPVLEDDLKTLLLGIDADIYVYTFLQHIYMSRSNIFIICFCNQKLI
jgi:hypothetical protein